MKANHEDKCMDAPTSNSLESAKDGPGFVSVLYFGRKVQSLTYRSVNVCAAPQPMEKIVNRNTANMIRGLRPKISLHFDKMIRKPVIRSDQASIIPNMIVPEYVRRYDVTIQLPFWKPFKALVIVTRDVLTMVVSMVDRNKLKHNLQRYQQRRLPWRIFIHRTLRSVHVVSSLLDIQ